MNMTGINNYCRYRPYTSATDTGITYTTSNIATYNTHDSLQLFAVDSVWKTMTVTGYYRSTNMNNNIKIALGIEALTHNIRVLGFILTIEYSITFK